jgi:hypothetical protein
LQNRKMDIYKCPKMKIPNTFGKKKNINLSSRVVEHFKCTLHFFSYIM